MSESSEALVNQVNQYIAELHSISLHLEQKDNRLPHVKLLQSKVNIKISHFQTALHQLMYSQHSKSALKHF